MMLCTAIKDLLGVSWSIKKRRGWFSLVCISAVHSLQVTGSSSSLWITHLLLAKEVLLWKDEEKQDQLTHTHLENGC